MNLFHEDLDADPGILAPLPDWKKLMDRDGVRDPRTILSPHLWRRDS